MTGFPVTFETPIPWGDLDLFQHVNNVAYFRYFQDARLKYFETIGLMDMHRDQGIGPILYSTDARFKEQLSYPNNIVVGARVSEMRTSSFVLEYAVEVVGGDQVAEGSSVNLVYDFNAMQKVPIPAVLRERICSLEQKQL